MGRNWLGAFLFSAPVAIYAIAGCSSSSDTSGGGGSPTSTPAAKVVGAAGGTVATSDGSAQVDIPAGALPGDTTITIAANASAPSLSGATAVGTPYKFGPDGLTFLKPITVTLAFDSAKLPSGMPSSSIVVYTAPDGSTTYAPLPTIVKDATHVTATTTHFCNDVAAVGTGAICAQGGAHCAGTSGPGCGAATPTCQSTDLCAQYPGSVVQSCTPDATGADASCCFPAGTQTCFKTGAGCGGGPGGGCTHPTCAASSPCGAYPNATVQSCTDNANGYDAVCCLPPGSPLPGSVNAAGGDAGMTGGDCPLACGGNSNGTCECHTSCNGHSYAMSCNGTMCTCTTDGSQTGSVTQGNACTGAQPFNAQQAYTSGCGYPGTSGGGTPGNDAGTGGTDAGGPSCTPQCGGSGSGCNCQETCMGHTYQLACTTGASCTCTVDGNPGTSSPTGTTCSSPQQVQALLQSQCGAP